MILVILVVAAAWPVGTVPIVVAAVSSAAWLAARLGRRKWIPPGVALAIGAVAVMAVVATGLAGWAPVGRDLWLALFLGLLGLCAVSARSPWPSVLVTAAAFVAAGIARPGDAFLPALVASLGVALAWVQGSACGRVSPRAVVAAVGLVLVAGIALFLVHPLPVQAVRALLVPEGGGPVVPAGFSRSVSIDEIREKPPAAAVLTVEFTEGAPPPILYLRVQALEKFEGNAWTLGFAPSGRRATAEGWIALSRLEPRGGTRLRGEIDAFESLEAFFLPVETVRLRAPAAVEYGPGTVGAAAGGVRTWGFDARWVSPDDPALDAVAVAGGGGEYYELPRGLDEIDRTATQVAGSAPTPAAKARAVCAWLRQGEYVDEIVPPEGMDPILFALRERRGWCVHFATLAALMLRAEGVPARVAWGLATPERTPRGVYIARWRHLHMWVEVFLREYGWVAFEPTPRTFDPGEDPPPIGVEIPRDARGEPAETAPSRLMGIVEDYVERPGAWPGVVLGLVAAGIVVRLAWRRARAPAVSWVRRLRQSAGPAGFFEEFLALLERRGLRMARGETALRFVTRLPTKVPAAPARLLVDLYYAVRFGGRALGESDRERIREAIRLLGRTT